MRLRVTCDLKYPFLIGKIRRALIKALPQNKISIVTVWRMGCLDISCYSNKLETLLRWKAKQGSKFVQKVGVPYWIFGRKEYIIQCLCGLIETDGSIYMDRGYKMVNVTSIIPTLVADVERMFKLLGFNPHTSRVIPKSKFNVQPCYHIRLSKNVSEFLKLVKPQKK